MKIKSEIDRKTSKKLEQLGQKAVTDLLRLRNPKVEVPLRTLGNVKFNEAKKIIEMGDEVQERSYFNLSMAKRFMQTYLVAAQIQDKLIKDGKSTSIRDLFYMCKVPVVPKSAEEAFSEQSESDPIIEDLEVTVDSLREELHLHADNKGSLVGEITIVDSGDTIDARRMGSGGWAVPSIVEPNIVQFKKCDAKYILLVEKAAMWRRLNEDKYWQRHKCILLHGQGQPPRGVRRLLHRMVNELKLPLFVLVDNDPWGYYIYSVIKQGSINLAYESQRMAVPQARFVGLSSFDMEKFELPPNVALKLKDEDVDRAKQLLEYPWFQKKEWQKEIRHMLKLGVKLELEALSNKMLTFATDVYLPKKMKDKDWLD